MVWVSRIRRSLAGALSAQRVTPVTSSSEGHPLGSEQIRQMIQACSAASQIVAKFACGCGRNSVRCVTPDDAYSASVESLALRWTSLNVAPALFFHSIHPLAVRPRTTAAAMLGDENRKSCVKK
jgi:hypothetical protein